MRGSVIQVSLVRARSGFLTCREIGNAESISTYYAEDMGELHGPVSTSELERASNTAITVRVP
jgi:hypothetical protein